MADTSGQEKTEVATPRRREEAREEGNVPRSTELSSVAILIVGVLAMYLYAPRAFQGLRLVMRDFLSTLHRRPIDEEGIPLMFWEIASRILDIVYPFTIALILGAILVNVAQVGLLFSMKSMKPKFSKLSPLEGAKRIFSARGAMELGKSLLKLAMVAPIMYSTIVSEVPAIAGLAQVPAQDILIYLGMLALKVVSRALLILLILALLDFAFQRFQHERDLKMTKQEVKEELKRTQGDPQIKSRIRQVQREVARRRMMAEVPEAEVVVTNPTEYAIALRYKQGEQEAPMVVAKGRNLIAQRIKEIARAAGVPIYEDRPLAQLLDQLTEVGEMIPPELYDGVASALAFVYRMEEQAKTQEQNASGF